jgi:hypothetical protein
MKTPLAAALLVLAASASAVTRPAGPSTAAAPVCHPPIAAVPDDYLPCIAADGRTEMLRVEQLDQAERLNYAAFLPGSEAANKFLFTRGYLRYCRLVMSMRITPLQLPKPPVDEHWNDSFLTDDEYSIVDTAVGMNLVARMGPQPPPAVIGVAAARKA